MQENTCVSNPLNGLLPWLSNYSQFVLLSETRGGSMARHKGTHKKKENCTLNTHFNPTFQSQIDVSKPFPLIETFILAWLVQHQVWEP